MGWDGHFDGRAVAVILSQMHYARASCPQGGSLFLVALFACHAAVPPAGPPPRVITPSIAACSTPPPATAMPAWAFVSAEDAAVVYAIDHLPKHADPWTDVSRPVQQGAGVGTAAKRAGRSRGDEDDPNALLVCEVRSTETIEASTGERMRAIPTGDARAAAMRVHATGDLQITTRYPDPRLCNAGDDIVSFVTLGLSTIVRRCEAAPTPPVVSAAWRDGFGNGCSILSSADVDEMSRSALAIAVDDVDRACAMSYRPDEVVDGPAFDEARMALRLHVAMSGQDAAGIAAAARIDAVAAAWTEATTPVMRADSDALPAVGWGLALSTELAVKVEGDYCRRETASCSWTLTFSRPVVAQAGGLTVDDVVWIGAITAVDADGRQHRVDLTDLNKYHSARASIVPDSPPVMLVFFDAAGHAVGRLRLPRPVVW